VQDHEMGDFKKLHVWQKAHQLALSAHRVAVRIRGAEYTSVRSQIIRAAMSIPANIVEGRDQKTEPMFARFLRIALASTSELEYHLIAARDISLISQSEYLLVLSELVEVRMMLHGLLRRLERPEGGKKETPDARIVVS